MSIVLVGPPHFGGRSARRAVGLRFKIVEGARRPVRWIADAHASGQWQTRSGHGVGLATRDTHGKRDFTPADGTEALRAAAANPILRLSLRIRIVFGLAIVFLMIAKPDAGESLLVLALASIVTIATSLTGRTTPSTAVQGYR